ncbi:YciI family protein [Agromyces sp. NPDC058126]|uniref:YciI family protein n=1 Tax=Agromyces sp. NPDC058126 TaxID=3346350 RepID=UPI0036DF6B73
MEYALLYAEGADALPYVAADDNVGEWVDEVVARGVSEFGERLRPEQDATTVRVRGGELLVSDGPFTESKESIGGFDVIDARDLDEAIEIASRHPVASFGRVEVRPFMRWPDAEPGARIVPAGFAEREPRGRRYLLLVIADPAGERPASEGADDDNGPEAWVTEMDGRGVRLFGEVLRGPEDATFVRRRDGEVLVADGPFTEAKEWIAGFDLLEVADLAEAIEVASKHPMARGGTLELRPLWPFDPHEDHTERVEREAAEVAVRLEPRAADAVGAVAGAGS